MELGQLVHEQDTTVSERDLTRAGRGSSADDGDTRCRVMRVAERALFYHGLSVHQQAGGAVDGRDLQDLLTHHRRHDPRQPFRKHCLARPRRAGEQDVVPSGRSNLHGPLGRRLALDVCEVQR